MRLRATVLLCLGAVLALTAAAQGAPDVATAGGMAQCGRDGRPVEAVSQTHTGARWRTATAEATQWFLLASPDAACREALRLLPELTRRTASGGSVTRIAFALDGWQCVASREARQAGCSVLVKGEERYIVLLAGDTVGEVVSRSLVDGSIGPRSLAPPAVASGGSGSSTAPESERRYRGAPAERCSSVEGKEWSYPTERPADYRARAYPAGLAGTRWRVYALGGLSCIAAQGWVEAVAPRIVQPRRAAVEMPPTGDPSWRCYTGGKMKVGLCVRTTSPRGPLDFKGAIITPDIPVDAYPFEPVSYERVISQMIAFNGSNARSQVEPRICSTSGRLVPSAEWRVGTRSGTVWILGTKGADFCFLANADVRRLAEWAASPVGGGRLAGVGGRWECHGYEGSMICTWDSLRIVLVPYLPQLAQASRDQMVRIALTVGSRG